MSEYFNSVKIDLGRCEGCAACAQRCPMDAIRVYDQKATIMEEKCIDCGECIRTCPNHAKVVTMDTLDKLSEYTYRIALAAPSLQVLLDIERSGDPVSFEDIQRVFLHTGFNDVFEVARAAEIVTFIVKQHLLQEPGKNPLFSSSCPAVLRLMETKFPALLKYAAAVLSPMEVAARLAKEEAAKSTGLPYEEIGAFFISPCPAKVTEMKQPILASHSAVDGVIGINLIYGAAVEQLSRKAPKEERGDLPKATEPRISACRLTQGSQRGNTLNKLSVSGIRNVISLLEEIERGRRPVNVDFIEVQACLGGCLEGAVKRTEFT